MSQLDFMTVLAISIHDMKNSLHRVLGVLDGFAQTDSGECRCDAQALGQLQYEARRVNDNLVQLLTLYRKETGLQEPHFLPLSVYELLEDAWLGNKPLMDQRGVVCALECDSELEWALDRELIEGLLDNVLTNTVRYSDGRIRLSARVENNALVLGVEDDGPGYPPAMLGRRHLRDSAALERRQGHTGLGLHFCALVADSHAEGAQRGFIELSNGGCWGGGCFQLVVPRLTPSGAAD